MLAWKDWKNYITGRSGYQSVVSAVAIALAVFQLYTGLFGTLDALMQRAIHLGFGLVLLFCVNPLRIPKNGNQPAWIDLAFALLATAPIVYVLCRYNWITEKRFSLLTPLSSTEIVLGVLIIALILEATRRVVGRSLLYVVVGFLLYPLIGPHLPGILRSAPIGFLELVDFLYLGTGGVFGIPLGVSATEIALFIIFGAVLMRSGGATLMNNLASAMAGKSPGGPAKVAVVASSLMGTISGSGTANVVTTGSVTIPMMKKAGYKAHFAGAVEAVASTGGQIMPPVMGATAFVMSAFSGIPYSTIIVYAIVPAILYYVGLFMMVHLEALRLKLPGVEPEMGLKEILCGYGHMVIPIVVLVYLLLAGFTPRLAGGIAVISALAASQLRQTTRLSVWDVLQAFEDGAKGLLVVITATAAAGLIVGVIDLTGLGQRLGAAFVALAGGSLLPALVLGMLLAILLGMGMPTTPAYVIQAATVIPALIQLGLPPFVAHMFAFYFACLSLITPPVAIAAYAAAGIAGSNIWETGWTAFRLGLAGYIVPFAFVYGPSLLLVGAPWEVFHTVLTAFLGVVCLAIAVEGYLCKSLSLWERVMAAAAAALLLAPLWETVVPGLILMGFLFAVQARAGGRRDTGAKRDKGPHQGKGGHGVPLPKQGVWSNESERQSR